VSECGRRRERWFTGSDDPENRPAEVVNAIALALLEEPALLADPLPPLDELLHDALEDQHHFHWRDFAAHRQGDTVSFSISGMPEALHVELSRRAHRYGMSFDQYVIAVLGHLAWRTPFAEDMEPWEHCRPTSRSSLRSSAIDPHLDMGKAGSPDRRIDPPN